MTSIKIVLHAVFSPRRTFLKGPSLREALIGSLSILILSTAILFLVSLINSNIDASARDLARERTNIPFLRIMYLLGWLLFLGYAALIRFGAFLVLGETGPLLKTAVLLTFVATIPLMLEGLVVGLLMSFATAISNQIAGQLLTVWLSLVLFLAALTWEGLIFVSGSIALIGQNTGRAVLCWLLPIMSAAVIALVVFQIRILML
ncbi:MAG: hypothetical protein HS115_17780 [Spirochaetales bacterium]|nr:hypothetical protein [Spirochaetales bacterium]